MSASLWRDRRFLSYWTGQSISQFGDQITVLALPLVAVGVLHASAGQVSWLTALSWLPSLLAIVLGAWVDRHTRKRRLMVLSDLARAALLATLPLAYLFNALTLPQLYAVAALAGIAAVTFNTANASFFAHLVPRRSYLQANSKLSISRSAALVGGPALGGLLVQALTAPVTLLADAVSFLASALLIARIPATETPTVPADAPASLLRRSWEGLRYVLRHPILRACLTTSTTMNFFTYVANTGLVVLFATRTLTLQAGTIGLAFGLGATGALLGAVIAPPLSRHLGLGRTIALGAVLYPAPLALVAAATGPLWLHAAALTTAEFLSSAGVMLYDINNNALQTSVTPDPLRSRVTGAYRTINYGIRPLGALTGGLLATLLGLRLTLLTGALGGCLCLLFLLASPVPKIRSLADDPSPDVHLVHS